MLRNTKWADLSDAQRAAVTLAGAAELVLTAIALLDLLRRSQDDVRGPKALWLLALAVQPIGPPTYLVVGRRRRVAR